jgi:glycosyltransferase involved in cell wall biosynthesis
MNFKENIFINPKQQIDQSAEIVFVSDMFLEDYVGGAELTTEALISESPFKVQKILSRNVNLATLQQGKDKFWIFGNFSQINLELIPSIVANLKYSVLEYDYKYCKYRSPEKHESATGNSCDCAENISGKIISAFYYGSTSLWWMSEGQKNRYTSLFPFLLEKDNVVLSSVFSKNTLGTIQWLRNQVSASSDVRQGWLVLGSTSWVKGFSQAEDWCKKNKKQYEVVWNLPYDQILDKLARAEGFVYLPMGADTCPRMVIEAKLLGCKLELNENVQHANEEWFNTNNLQDIHEYLYSAPELFWKSIKLIMNHKITISGYTTAYNCIKQEYPFEQCIRSMIRFCDEVCIVDGGSTDGTYEKLSSIAEEFNTPDNEKVKIKIVPRDWNHPRHAVFDGAQKAAARSMCTGDFCWQMDSDEVVHELDAPKIIDLCQKIPNNVDIVSLPVIEYWGGSNKVRADIQPWKWRLSKNAPHITHGIPSDLRRVDSNGDVYAAEGTDGCDMIDKNTGNRLPHVTFHTSESEAIRQSAVNGNYESLQKYELWFNAVIQNLPGVHHYSWHNIPRKMRLYRDYWTKHWNSLFNKSLEDTAESNMMFDVPWSQVTNEMIEERASEFSEKTGGWIFHSKWRGQVVPHIKVNVTEPTK